MLNEYPLLRFAKGGEGGGERGKKTCKKRKLVHSSTIINFVGGQGDYKNNYPLQLKFVENLVLFIVKGYNVVSYVESFWLQILVMWHDLNICFPSHKQLGKNRTSKFAFKMMETYLSLTLSNYATITITFDL
jgi:hypothetical protein